MSTPDDDVVAALRARAAVPAPTRPAWRSRRALVPAGVLAAVALVGGGLAVARPGGQDSASVRQVADVEHLFAVEQRDDGVLAVRTWRLRGEAGDRLEGTLRLENPGTAVVTGDAAEVLPAPVRDARWAPRPDGTPEDRVAVFRYALAARGRLTVSYTARVPAGPVSQERLDALAADQQAAAAAYAEATAAPPPAVLASLSVTPPVLRVAAGRSGRLGLAGTLSDGTPAGRSVLAGTAWTSDRPAVVLVRGGTVYGVAPGRATVTAVQDDAQGSAVVEVVPAPVRATAPPPPPVVAVPVPAAPTATSTAPSTSAPPAPRPGRTRATARPRPASTTPRPRPTTTPPRPRPTTAAPRPAPTTPRPATTSPRPAPSTARPTPARPTAPPPPAGSQYVVNDDSIGAARSGPWQQAPTGWAGASWFVSTKPSGCQGAPYAAFSWQARLPAAGVYRLEVYVPAEAAATAVYRVRTGSSTVRAGVDQGRSQGRWRVLLVSARVGTSPAVVLDNALGQPGGCAEQQRLGADAVRWTYLRP